MALTRVHRLVFRLGLQYLQGMLSATAELLPLISAEGLEINRHFSG